MKGGEDGIRDHNGELLPVLSTSATKMDYEKLVNSPLPKFEKNYPGSPFFMEFGYFCLRRVHNTLFRTIEVSGIENIPKDRGSMCSAWHTNGLLDPISIFLTHPRKFVVGGRHDLVTRPILGFWARKFAVQPVVRKAELLRGGCSDEEANYLNGRSLLNLATGISHGFGCALFPEGTSHSESHLIRLKTGPVRTVLAAAAHAKSTGVNIPVIIPIGLHFRTRHFFRTDCWVEYGEPIELPVDELPDELLEAVKNGDWSEPPSEVVINIRNTLEEKLAPMTPNRETFSEVHRDGVIAHVQSRINSKPSLSWREEVLEVRRLKQEPASQEVQELATKVGDTLNEAVLDGRDINSTSTGLRGISPTGAINNLAKLIPMLILLPAIIIGMGPQIILGRLLGDSTDEGQDARTSYQLLAGMFGSLGWWPILSTILTVLCIIFNPELNTELGLDWMSALGNEIWQEVFAGLGLWLCFVAIFWLSGIFFALGWDPISDAAKWLRRRKTNKKVSSDLSKLRELLK
ncbi:MAG: hypothetical protein HOE76_02205 [Euryarchaeota archaeon]|jgi:1-acyl-sn-glycerol-3-phosphate acyltransferase|nr:hypothetical protein [Euryarchaeota archaeon]MBT4981873.1 hypothetical protein [Euryarchaeota archaeon]